MKANPDEIPNETTIKALKEEELFSANSAEEMITDCLDGNESWKNIKRNSTLKYNF